MPDSLIAARIANNMERVLREQGKGQYADQFKGFDWKTEEDAFMDGYHNHEKGGEFVTYERLRAMGTNGFQEPATAFTDGKIIGTKRLFADGKFGTKDGKAKFMETQWRGLQAPGKEEERKKWPFLVNNGRANIIWQNAYLDQDNEFVMDRMPYPYIQMNPEDMAELKLKQGDLVEVYNDNGSTQAMAYPTPTAKRKQTFMLFAYPTGVQGNVVSAGVNEFVIPNYKQTWGEYPQDRGRAGRREASQLQVDRIRRLTSPPLSTSAGQFRRPAITGNRPGAQNVPTYRQSLDPRGLQCPLFRPHLLDHGRLDAALADHGERVAGGAAVRIVIDRDAHRDVSAILTGPLTSGLPSSQFINSMPTKAPQSSATMKPGRSLGRIPANVFVSERAIATAGLANEVEAVNQYAAVM